MKQTSLNIVPETKTIKGPTWRVQIHVFDFTDGSIPAWKELPVKFAVDRLNAKCHRSTPFSSGTQMYYGTSLSEAMRCASVIVQRDISGEIPKAWNKYLMAA